MRGREKQRQIAHEGIQRLAGGAPSRFDGKFGGVHGVPELGEPGGAEAGGRLLFGLLIGRAHADLFPGKDLPELACLALEHGEQIEKRFLALGLFLKDAFPDGSGLPRLKLAQEREYVEFGRRADAAGLFLRQRCSSPGERQIHPMASAKVKQGSLAICAGILGCPFSHATSRQNRGHV